jgi:energy-coupling factor transporter ATP-binding protein EcfA2
MLRQKEVPKMSSIVLYGPPGSGKTTMAATMCKLGYTVHAIDVDNKMRKMMNIKPLIDAGKIIVYPIEDHLVEDTLRARILHPEMKPLKQPQGYLHIVDQITKFQTTPPPDALEKGVILVDSMSRVEEHLKRLICHIQGKNKFEFTEWGILKSNYEELFDTVYSLPFKHQIMIFHSQVEEDQITGSKQFKPLLDGQTKDKVGKDIEEMYFMSIGGTKDAPIYQVTTKPVGRVQQARTSRNLKTTEPADFSVIFKEEKV